MPTIEDSEKWGCWWCSLSSLNDKRRNNNNNNIKFNRKYFLIPLKLKINFSFPWYQTFLYFSRLRENVKTEIFHLWEENWLSIFSWFLSITFFNLADDFGHDPIWKIIDKFISRVVENCEEFFRNFPSTWRVEKSWNHEQETSNNISSPVRMAEENSANERRLGLHKISLELWLSSCCDFFFTFSVLIFSSNIISASSWALRHIQTSSSLSVEMKLELERQRRTKSRMSQEVS